MQRKGYIKQEELDFIKRTYSESDVKALRSCFFREITKEDIEKFGNEENIRILKKIFIPEYDPVNGEIFDNPDTIGRVEPMGFDFETLSVVMKAQIYASEFIRIVLDSLRGGVKVTTNNILDIELGEDSKENAQIIFNRATTMRIIESGIQGIYTISKVEDETEEEKRARISKNSLK